MHQYFQIQIVQEQLENKQTSYLFHWSLENIMGNLYLRQGTQFSCQAVELENIFKILQKSAQW